MSSAIVLPSLTAWAEQRLTALFTTTDEQSFDAAFDAFVAAHTTSIVVNGQKLSREQYKQQTWKDKFLEAGAQVQYLGAVSVPSDPSEPVKAGEVGLFVKATIDEKLLVLGAPETNTITLSLILSIIQDPTLKPPTLPHGIRGDFDGRRVASFVAVSTTNPDAIRLPGPIINPGGPIKPPTA